MIAATFPISAYITETYRPNMGTWVIPYFLLVVVTSIPVGLLAACTARLATQNLFTSPLAPLVACLGMVLIPYFMIPAMKDVRSGFAIQTLLLLFWTSGAPFFFGITVYLFRTLALANDESNCNLDRKNSE